MSAEAVILARLDAIEQQNRQVLAMLASLTGGDQSCQPRPASCSASTEGNPYAHARQLAREGKRAESVEETRRVSRMLAKQEAAGKKNKRVA